MKKAIYHISGFDCANCAAKVERHLNKKENVYSAVIDFTNERLFLTYRGEPFTEEEILKAIKEVEGDPIRLEAISVGKKKREKLFDVKDYVLIARIVLSTILMVTARILQAVMFKGIENWQGEKLAWILIVIYSVALVVCLYDIVIDVFKIIIHKENPIDEHLLMTVSCMGAFCIAFFKEAEPVFFDGVMVLVLFQIGELLEDVLSKKSKAAISNAIDLRADVANLVTNDKVVTVKPDTLKEGDLIVVRVGEIVPVDGVVTEGEGSLDTSSLTGEPLPVDVRKDSHVLSGTILKSGSLTLKVEKVFSDSTIYKIMELVQNSGERKSKVDKFITRFARFYTPSVFVIAVLFLVIYGLITNDWAMAAYRSVFVLIVGCPCAIVISVPLAYFAGIGLASKKGVVIKGASVLDQLCKSGVLFVDKTGTLTYGNFEVTKMIPSGIKEDELKTYVLAAESRSNHPIAKAVVLHQNVGELALKQERYEELAGYGVRTHYEGKCILAGNHALLEKEGISAPLIEENGTVIYVACNKKYVGYVLLQDIVRDKAKQLVSKLNSIGVKTILLSGDTIKNVEDVAHEVGIEEFHAKLLPQEKTKYVEEEIVKQRGYKTVLFAGDGINDTPSIIRADVGFAMGGIGSDVAVENADAVIMQDHPLKIYHAIKIARMTRTVAIFNIVFAISIKVAAMILNFVLPETSFLYAYLPIIDVVSDTGLTLILVLNSLLLFYRKVR